VGAKRYGLFQDNELVFTLPLDSALKIKEGLLMLEKTNRLHLPIVNGFLSPTKPVDYLIK